MHRPTPKHWALVAGLTLVLSTVAFSTYGLVSGDGGAGAGQTGSEDATASRPSSSGLGPFGLDPDTELTLLHTPPFPLDTEGVIPTRSEALDFADRYSRFTAVGDEGIDKLAAEGHFAGSGTPENPYILERFYVDGDLTLESLDRAIILREGYVTGQLSLNYIGEQVYVHHVYAEDLRINENVERSGPNTGGLFHDNEFGFVGQIRHFIGEFHGNTIGPRPDGVLTTFLGDTGTANIPDGVVFNFDGFHGADVHHNTFLGQVDIKLHGHNHGDCLTCPVHDHSFVREFPEGDLRTLDTTTPVEGGHEHDAHDHGNESATTYGDLGFKSRHSIRYHSLLFRDNTITVEDGPALRYNDRNHAGDDQTANSEPNPHLEDAHVHFQDITFRGNTLIGGPLVLEIFNAEDDNHPVLNHGVLRIHGNSVQIPYQRTLSESDEMLFGIDLRRAEGIALRLTENTVTFVEQADDLPAATLRSALYLPPPLAGFRLMTFQAGHILLVGNTVNTGDYGVYTHTLAPTVFWNLVGNDFKTEDAYRADSTANLPGEEAEAAEEGY